MGLSVTSSEKAGAILKQKNRPLFSYLETWQGLLKTRSGRDFFSQWGVNDGTAT